MIFGLLAACSPSPTPPQTASPAPSEPSNPTQVAKVTYPTGCGSSALIDHLGPLGDTPSGAAHSFVESYRDSKPADAVAAAARDAILASSTLLVDEGGGGERRFVARDAAGVLAIYAVTPWSDEGYVVSWYWVRLPDEFCPAD
jgi:hypothetical protein